MRVGIIGAGPAGLFAAWQLSRRGIEVVLFEARQEVGGISRSFVWHGFTCDLGAHRLFSHDEAVLRQLLALVPMHRHMRKSKLYLAGRWIHDPVNIVEILYRYFPITAMQIIWGYLVRPRQGEEISFNDFVNRRYGQALNEFFFSPYTEKMFNLPGERIAADWARRKVRIAGPLDFLRESSRKHFSYFYYPQQGGFGAIIEHIYREIQDHVRLETPVIGLELQGNEITAIVYEEGGIKKRESFDHVISTLPLGTLGRMLGYDFSLDYQGVDFVYLLVDKPSVSSNHWIYFIDHHFAINRLVEFKNLSAGGQPEHQTVVCAEVTNSSEDVVDRVIENVVRAGLIKRQEVTDTLVIHEPYGYAVYDLNYSQHLLDIREILDHYRNLHLLGRSAEFQHLEIDEIYANALTLAASLAPLTSVKDRTMEDQIKSQSAQPPVCVVVLTYNHYDDTQECLRSIRQSDYQNLSIVVVDNGSSDGTPEHIRAEFPQVHVIETGHNLGVPWGYNVGFSYALRAGYEYILMLNNDTVVDSGMISELVKAADADTEAGVLVPKIFYYDDPETIWAIGGRHRAFPPAHVILGRNRPGSMFNMPFYLDYALSCGLLIRRSTFEKAGLFDPGYFFFFDDWDFSMRVREAGIKILFVPDAWMWHKVSKTTRSVPDEFFWHVWGASSARFYKRHYGRLSMVAHIAYLILREAAKGNIKMLPSFLRGIWEEIQSPLGDIPSAESAVLEIQDV